MALVSMTGFARSEGEHHDLRWSWELKTVNGRSQDVRTRLPPGFDSFDPDIRTAVGTVVKRGNCQAALHVTRIQGTGELRVNEDALAQVLDAVDRISRRLGDAKATPDGILALRGVLEFVEPEDEQNEAVTSERNAAMMADLRSAIDALRDVRQAEGARLEIVLREQVDEILRLTTAARDCPARSAAAIAVRLKEHIDRILANSSTFDEDRLHQEAVMLAAKADVQEELDRLFAHVDAARELLEVSEPVGRKFDFLTQEFNREANTLCSKANDRELTRIGLDLKAVIDQMREQVQNIE
jgi:uncharacterized protein (TIGR00255 family)